MIWWRCEFRLSFVARPRFKRNINNSKARVLAQGSCKYIIFSRQISFSLKHDGFVQTENTVSSWPRCLESRCFALESLKVKHQMYTNQPLDADFFNRLWLNLSLCCYFNVRRRSVTVSSSGAQSRPFDTQSSGQNKRAAVWLQASPVL